MNAFRILVVLSVASIATACASPGATRDASPSPGMAPMHTGAAHAMVAMDPRMKSMHDMHQKMTNATTPAERQALMADHMKAMQGGMAKMREMHAMHASGGMGGKGGMGTMGSPSGAAPVAGMDHGKGMPADMAEHHPMMADHMAMMQMMMDMMADRMAPAATGR